MNKLKYRLTWFHVDISESQSDNIIELINKALSIRGQVLKRDLAMHTYTVVIEVEAMNMDHQDSFIVRKIYEDNQFYNQLLPFHNLEIEFEGSSS